MLFFMLTFMSERGRSLLRNHCAGHDIFYSSFIVSRFIYGITVTEFSIAVVSNKSIDFHSKLRHTDALEMPVNRACWLLAVKVKIFYTLKTISTTDSF